MTIVELTELDASKIRKLGEFICWVHQVLSEDLQANQLAARQKLPNHVVASEMLLRRFHRFMKELGVE